jgi:DNA (cytosine-5)-methyltransferase 1
MNYYNEFDKNAVAWLRELIKLGAIPDGEVDERSIEDVRADDLKGFAQCHFFAGIGGWPEALRRAGVPATRPLWTGSCPCQDFSCAGKQEGFEGKRDLWPAFHDLIRQCRPELVFGEQVKNAVRHGWLDRLYADLEGEGYACGSAILGAHSAGADHIRQRIYWVANAESCGLQHKPMFRSAGVQHKATGAAERVLAVGGHGAGACGLADSIGDQKHEEPGRPEGYEGKRSSIVSGGCGVVGRLADAFGERGCGGQSGREDAGDAGQSGQARNFWSDARPHLCKDGKWRRFESRIFPLVAKLPRGVVPSGDPRLPGYANATSEARVMRLKGYGNAICVDTAVLFIETCEEILK